MGPLGLYVGWGWDGKLGRLSSMGTTWESTKTEIGWVGMRLMCHTVGGRRWDCCVIGNVGLLCHWQCGIVREIQYGTKRPQQPAPNEKQTIPWYTVIICRLLSYSVFSKDEGLHQTKCTMPPNLATQPQTQHKQVDEK